MIHNYVQYFQYVAMFHFEKKKERKERKVCEEHGVQEQNILFIELNEVSYTAAENVVTCCINILVCWLSVIQLTTNPKHKNKFQSRVWGFVTRPFYKLGEKPG